MAEIRELHTLPLELLQQFIIILRTNEDFIGEGKIDDYYLYKSEEDASIIYDNGEYCYIVEFVKNELDQWFFRNHIPVRRSVKNNIPQSIIKKYGNTNKEKAE